MKRRQFVASATATIAASLAGCSGLVDRDGGSPGPASALEDYVAAINANDPVAFEAAMHPDAPLSGSAPTASELQSISVSISASEVTEGPDNGAAVVTAVFDTTVGIDRSEPRTTTREVSFDVRRYEGDWKLYEEV